MKYLNISSNKGMYLETFLNKTIQFYKNNNFCWFKKQNLFFSPINVHEKHVEGKLICKNDVDYYGIYNGIFVCFEAKQTQQNKFLLSNIKDHQWQYLETINFYGGISFLIISFLEKNEFFAISFKNLLEIKNKEIKTLNYELMNKFGKKLNIKLPGIIDILSFIEIEFKERKFNVKLSY